MKYCSSLGLQHLGTQFLGTNKDIYQTYRDNIARDPTTFTLYSPLNHIESWYSHYISMIFHYIPIILSVLLSRLDPCSTPLRIFASYCFLFISLFRQNMSCLYPVPAMEFSQCLVSGIPTPLKNMSSSVGMIPSQYLGKIHLKSIKIH